jgi:hypothetical protein
MSQEEMITASLEGARILIDKERCELQEYDFAANRWLHRESAEWPLPRDRADEWLTGWNCVDRFAAMNILTKPAEYWDDVSDRAARKRGGQGTPPIPAR